MTIYLLTGVHWVFIAVLRFSVVEASGGYSSRRYTGFSLRYFS